MRFQGVITLLTFTVLLYGCNENLASNRHNNLSKPTLVTEPVGVFSGIHRERGTKPITYQSEIGINSEAAHIRAIPDIRFDDEGGDEKNVTTRTFRVRPVNICGMGTKQSLKEKIADCLSKNPDRTIWNGTIDAGSAESTWTLVRPLKSGSINELACCGQTSSLSRETGVNPLAVNFQLQIMSGKIAPLQARA